MVVAYQNLNGSRDLTTPFLLGWFGTDLWQNDRQTHDDSIYRASIVSRVKNSPVISRMANSSFLLHKNAHINRFAVCAPVYH